MQCLRCQHKNRPQAKFCEECASPLDGATRTAPSYADLKAEVEGLRPALGEALEQHTATAEILRVISGSPTGLQAVFDTIARNVVRLCNGVHAGVFRFDGELIHLVAHHNFTPQALVEFERAYPMRPTRESLSARAILDRAVVHVPDVESDRDAAASHRLGRATGYRSVLSVPMLRDGLVIGGISVGRAEKGPFSDRHIDLVRTFADQAVIAIENVRLFGELEARNRDITEALEQQTATAEILSIISSSPTDIQPIFDTIMRSAVRLSGARFGAIYRFDGEMVHFVAQHGSDNDALEVYRRMFPMHPDRGVLGARAILDRAVVHVPDVFQDTEYRGKDLARASGWSSLISVPMLREDTPIGAISISKTEPGPFSDSEIELLKTFADQAVIAIENVRLFTELQEKNRALTAAHTQVTEALEQQTATGEVLRVISRSPTDIQPVLETIVEHAGRVCGAFDAIVFLVDGDRLVRTAHRGPVPITEGSLSLPIERDSASGVAVLECRTVHVEDLLTSREFPRGRAIAERSGFRTAVSVPLVTERAAIGTLVARRTEMQPFTSQQIALLETFADQAVIAIENVRLFKELEARNRDLTATSEILRVISSSPTDVQPVFDTIVRSAVTLCDGLFSALFQFDGELLQLVAHHNFTVEALEEAHRVYPTRPSRGQGSTRAILERSVVHIPDVEVDPEYRTLGLARLIGWRSGLFVPMLREGAPIGVIMVARAEAAAFSDNEIELLKTFADQAVIAVENVRLFKELQARTAELTQSVEKLTALGEVSQALSSTLDLDTVLTTIVTRAVHLSGADGGQIFEYDEVAEEFQPRASNEVEDVVAATQHTRLRKGEGAVGRMAVTREAVQIPDIALEGAYESRARGALLRSGRHALLAVPLLSEEHIVGGLVISRNAAGAFPAEVVELLKTFATQSALAIQNARLFHEIEDKSRQLEAASRHKSEFLANMSHELRTPLNAVIGFSEVLLQRMFGDLNAKQDEYLKDIYASGQHLLSLINDILDLSKIEAGRMELTPAPFHLPTALENAVTLVRERAARHGIALHLDLDPRLGELVGDERKVKQVLLNLLSNAVKFTPEGGRISLKASRTDGTVEIAVTDTGIGIAPEDQAAIFEEFRQVGADETRKQEGTGLGLTLAKKFIELHGGRIWVESELGRGSTFTFTLPVS